jgi:hypothetical protein
VRKDGKQILSLCDTKYQRITQKYCILDELLGSELSSADA